MRAARAPGTQPFGLRVKAEAPTGSHPVSLTAIKTPCCCMRSGLMAFTCPLSRPTFAEVAWGGVSFQRPDPSCHNHICANSQACTHTHGYATLQSDVQQTLQGLVFTDQGRSSEGESKSDECTQQRACQRLVFPGHCCSTWGGIASPLPLQGGGRSFADPRFGSQIRRGWCL